MFVLEYSALQTEWRLGKIVKSLCNDSHLHHRLRWYGKKQVLRFAQDDKFNRFLDTMRCR